MRSSGTFIVLRGDTYYYVTTAFNSFGNISLKVTELTTVNTRGLRKNVPLTTASTQSISDGMASVVRITAQVTRKPP
ncbi:hypothetical protein PS925_02139 [Pseudomonas fluorescens]|uniref:Uncharacterized protein n=1 Tax=Pseudomonas fluorescens TaxID=294 RepID=A0A5E7TLJ6_PSEFL|nr:hypothetical protein PS925_02139 [Pseudomonas fluorescens]